ncbi:hypothetical protein B808_1017 [Fructilactobacillus florum 8D]|uniref:MucBP domain-containing protein n=1 Tax=Fructilactobacillus florum 8D TaxID=1221538 RepID=W9EK60_9LACO|nr:MucBP domain-containing protein [Fructilactobacillus florum]EKK20091.1 hypothetical protein B807_1163 [Fructilactobacillus florum 2F]ETO40069.1 hypothetical protein B808_1017 [Fructilactobacillus florum 8D]
MFKRIRQRWRKRRQARTARLTSLSKRPVLPQTNLAVPEKPTPTVSKPVGTVVPETAFIEPPTKKARIFINYHDEQHRPLQQPDIFVSELGQRLQITIPEIPNYYFNAMTGITSHVVQTSQVVTLHYRKQTGKAVLIYCFDFDDHHLLKIPTFAVGPIDTEYYLTAPAIADYRLYLWAGKLRGRFSKQSQTIVCYYRRTNWQLVQPVNYLVTITTTTSIYPEPEQHQPHPIRLPRGSVWKVFKEVQTTETTWLFLGGAEWIKKSATSRLTSQPSLSQ